jgi:quercetin dioxygenase-like cupin family protein
MPPIYYADARLQVRFAPEGPQPLFVLDGDQAKVLLAGLEPGQRIPVHPEALAAYTILEGTGTMQVGDEEHPIGPGSLIVVPAGVRRGMVAETRLSFVAARFGA